MPEFSRFICGLGQLFLDRGSSSLRTTVLCTIVLLLLFLVRSTPACPPLSLYPNQFASVHELPVDFKSRGRRQSVGCGVFVSARNIWTLSMLSTLNLIIASCLETIQVSCSTEVVWPSRRRKGHKQLGPFTIQYWLVFGHCERSWLISFQESSRDSNPLNPTNLLEFTMMSPSQDSHSSGNYFDATFLEEKSQNC